MQVLKYGQKLNKNAILCLGYFDAFHKGHKRLIEVAKQTAKSQNLAVATLLFTGGKNNEKDVFTLEERLEIAKKLGVEIAIVQPLDCEFMAKDKSQFVFDILNFNSIKAVVSGKDFRFGKNALGNVNYLKEICAISGVESIVLDDIVNDFGERYSSKNVKKLLDNGEIEKVNDYLGHDYFIQGEVVAGKKLGSKIGFPTANIIPNDSKYLIKRGVYLTYTNICGKTYKCLTNVGAQPTFKGKNEIIESYIDNFSGDLYGKTITFNFVKRIRDIYNFSSKEELINQLKKDKEFLL